MTHFQSRLARFSPLTAALFLSAGFLDLVSTAHAQATSQSTFSSADDGLQALVAAAKAKDRDALRRLFGPDYDQLLSGDEGEDANHLDEFALAIGESARPEKHSGSKYTVPA